MIVAPVPGGLRIVLQVDHQRQCALMAAAWGNAGFARPAPFGPLERAAAWHDEGWRTWEAAPEATADGRPLNFSEIAPAPHVALYRDGIIAAARRDLRAGLIVSMHGQGLYEKRRGLDGDPPPRASRPAVVQRFLRDQDAVQEGLRARIGPGPELDAWAWAGYRLLQAWDVLSLYLVWTPLGAGRTWRLPRVPRDTADAAGVDLALAPAGPDVCTVEPWPFAGDRVELPVRARVIPDRRYRDHDDLRTALAAAPWADAALAAVPAR